MFLGVRREEKYRWTQCAAVHPKRAQNILQHKRIICPRQGNSVIKKKNFLNTKVSIVIRLGTTKQSASLGSTAPVDHSIKVAQFKNIDAVEPPPPPPNIQVLCED